MMIEFEHSASVKEHVEKLVKTKVKDKEQKRADLIEGLVLLKQLKHYSLNRPDFSPTGCIPAWYQQNSRGGVNSSDIVEFVTVIDNDSSENDFIDIDTLEDGSAVTVATAHVKIEAVGDHDNILLHNDDDLNDNDLDDASTSSHSVLDNDVEQTAWIGHNDDIDADNLDDSAATVATALVRTEQVVDQHENSLNDDELHADDHVLVGASSTTLEKKLEQWICLDDETYNGDLVDGVFHGYGIYSCSTFKYTGGYSNGQMHGNGEITYSNGATYKGEFEMDKFHGYGEHTT
jgi:MORN repeat